MRKVSFVFVSASSWSLSYLLAIHSLLLVIILSNDINTKLDNKELVSGLSRLFVAHAQGVRQIYINETDTTYILERETLSNTMVSFVPNNAGTVYTNIEIIVKNCHFTGNSNVAFTFAMGSIINCSSKIRVEGNSFENGKILFSSDFKSHANGEIILRNNSKKSSISGSTAFVEFMNTYIENGTSILFENNTALVSNANSGTGWETPSHLIYFSSVTFSSSSSTSAFVGSSDSKTVYNNGIRFVNNEFQVFSGVWGSIIHFQNAALTNVNIEYEDNRFELIGGGSSGQLMPIYMRHSKISDSEILRYKNNAIICKSANDGMHSLYHYDSPIENVSMVQYWNNTILTEGKDAIFSVLYDFKSFMQDIQIVQYAFNTIKTSGLASSNKNARSICHHASSFVKNVNIFQYLNNSIETKSGSLVYSIWYREGCGIENVQLLEYSGNTISTKTFTPVVASMTGVFSIEYNKASQLLNIDTVLYVGNKIETNGGADVFCISHRESSAVQYVPSLVYADNVFSLTSATNGAVLEYNNFKNPASVISYYRCNEENGQPSSSLSQALEASDVEINDCGTCRKNIDCFPDAATSVSATGAPNQCVCNCSNSSNGQEKENSFCFPTIFYESTTGNRSQNSAGPCQWSPSNLKGGERTKTISIAKTASKTLLVDAATSTITREHTSKSSTMNNNIREGGENNSASLSLTLAAFQNMTNNNDTTAIHINVTNALSSPIPNITSSQDGNNVTTKGTETTASIATSNLATSMPTLPTTTSVGRTQEAEVTTQSVPPVTSSHVPPTSSSQTDIITSIPPSTMATPSSVPTTSPVSTSVPTAEPLPFNFTEDSKTHSVAVLDSVLPTEIAEAVDTTRGVSVVTLASVTTFVGAGTITTRSKSIGSLVVSCSAESDLEEKPNWYEQPLSVFSLHSSPFRYISSGLLLNTLLFSFVFALQQVTYRQKCGQWTKALSSKTRRRIYRVCSCILVFLASFLWGSGSQYAALILALPADWKTKLDIRIAWSSLFLQSCFIGFGLLMVTGMYQGKFLMSKMEFVDRKKGSKYVEQWGYLLDGLNSGSWHVRLYFFVEILNAMIFGILAGVAPANKSKCFSLGIGMCIVAVFYLAYVLFFHPLDSKVEHGFVCICGLLQLVMAVAAAVSTKYFHPCLEIIGVCEFILAIMFFVTTIAVAGLALYQKWKERQEWLKREKQKGAKRRLEGREDDSDSDDGSESENEGENEDEEEEMQEQPEDIDWEDDFGLPSPERIERRKRKNNKLLMEKQKMEGMGWKIERDDPEELANPLLVEPRKKR